MRLLVLWLPWLLLGMISVMLAGVAWLTTPATLLITDLVSGALPLTFGMVGAMIVRRRPANPIGWIFSGYGFFLSLGIFSETYALDATRPWADWVMWEASWGWAPGIFSLVTFLPLLFPDGSLPAPHWRWVVWVTGCGIALVVFSQALNPGPFPNSSLINPLGVEGAVAICRIFYAIGLAFVAAGALGSIVSVVLRFRRSKGDERQQLKWFLSGVVLTALGIAGLLITFGLGYTELPYLIFGIGAIFLPISVGIAILRYRLYDIDLIINRALVYGSLTASLGIVYFGSVVLLQGLFQLLAGQGQSELATVATTLAIAALFSPLRRRIQDFFDRRFYRKKYDAVQTLAEFSASLRDEVDLDKMNNRLVSVVYETMQPENAWLWLREIRRES